jgi:metal transporter CNNM
VIRGALDLTVKCAEVVMTPLSKAFMVSSEARLDGSLRAALLASGHSRVPVYRRGNRWARGCVGV